MCSVWLYYVCSFLSSATNCEMVSSWCREREWKLKRYTMTEGGGCRCFWTGWTSSLNDFVEGFSGSDKFRSNWYIDTPQMLSSIACCFIELVMSFAVKNCCSRFVYDSQSSRAASNSPMKLDVDIRVYPRCQKCVINVSFQNGEDQWKTARSMQKWKNAAVLQVHHILECVCC